VFLRCRYLDVSNNQLSGSLPDTLCHFTILVSVFPVTLWQNCFFVMRFVCTHRNLTLADNQFNGTILPCIANFMSLEYDNPVPAIAFAVIKVVLLWPQVLGCLRE
jgi:hypothetical protein